MQTVKKNTVHGSLVPHAGYAVINACRIFIGVHTEFVNGFNHKRRLFLQKW